MKLLMPALSPTMEKGNLKCWLVKEGQQIKSGDLLAEIETDKAVMEWESIIEGAIEKIIVNDGAIDVPVDTLVAIVRVAGESSEDCKASVTDVELPKKSEPAIQADSINNAQQKSCSQSAVIEGNDRIKASPVAKKIASEKGLDLSTIKGTGPGDRIIKNDVINLSDAALKKSAPVKLPNQAMLNETVKVSNMRRIIAARLLESKTTVPHFYLEIDCILDDLMSAREAMNAELALSGIKITVNDFIIKAVALAIRKNPKINASWHGDSITSYSDINVCVAIAVEDGLVAPAIRNADTLSLVDISSAIKGLAAKARSGKIMPEDMQGGTFSVSNLGMYGIKKFSAIINPPQSAILAVGAGSERVVVDNGSFRVAKVMTVVLSVDHRVVDGALGAQFLASFKEYIEKPILMFVG